jgi:ATP-dependent Clp protease ATP-binding subunit ClpC
MFERFTDRSRKVMALACQQAQRLYHEDIAPEHVLLGILKEGNNVATVVLDNAQIDRWTIAQRITELHPADAKRPPHLGKFPYTPATKKIIEDASLEARRLGHNYVGIEHLFLALLQPADPPTVPNVVFQQFGITLDSGREMVLELMGAGVEAIFTENPSRPLSQYQSLIYTAAVALASRKYIPPLQHNQIAECVKDAELILDYVKTHVPRN